jgi:hypothetical protein
MLDNPESVKQPTVDFHERHPAPPSSPNSQIRVSPPPSAVHLAELAVVILVPHFSSSDSSSSSASSLGSMSGNLIIRDVRFRFSGHVNMEVPTIHNC